MKYRIIGDVHGRTEWKKLILKEDEGMNIFLGDYFDPYDDFSFEELQSNFNDVIGIPNAILLIGNHDFHYLLGECESTRYDFKNNIQIRKMFLDNIEKFRVVYNINDKVVCSHAGLTKKWFENHIGDANMSVAEKCEAVESLFWRGKTVGGGLNEGLQYFTFEAGIPHIGDHYGESKGHGPLWARYNSLVLADHNNLFEGEDVKQVVGHSRVAKPTLFNDFVYYNDCLEKGYCLEYDSDTNEFKEVRR